MTYCRPHGYTLMEILIVVTLLAVLSAGTTVRLAPTLQRARNERAIDSIMMLERRVRDACRRNRHRGYLRYSIDKNSVAGEVDGNEIQTLELPTGFKLEKILTARASGAGRSEEIYAGTTGQTESYAMVFRSLKKSRVVLFSGVTGKPIFLESEDEAQQLLAELTP